MEKKLHIEKNTIQETLVIPLYARKLCTELYPFLFKDEQADDIIKQLDYDFDSLKDKFSGVVQKFGSLEIAVRQYDVRQELFDYILEHPHCSVVNLGCGLDQSAEAMDNGFIKMYNIDMPDVIQVRNEILPPKERVKNISCDLNDIRWFDEVEKQDGVIFFGTGVFYYFKKEEIEHLFNAMAMAFPGGRLVFDICGLKGCKMMMKNFVKEAGITDVEAYFHVDHLNIDIASWLRHAKVSQKPYMYGYHDLNDKSISWLFHKIAKFGDKNFKMTITRIDFDEA